MVSIDKKGDEEGIFETTSQVEEGASPRIMNTDQDTEKESRLKVNIEKLSLVLTGVHTINSEYVVELQSIGTTVVGDNDTL